MGGLAAGWTDLVIVRAIIAAALARGMGPAPEETGRLREDGAGKEGRRVEVRRVHSSPFVLSVSIPFARTSAAGRSIRWPSNAISCPARHGSSCTGPRDPVRAGRTAGSPQGSAPPWPVGREWPPGPTRL